MPSMEWKRNLNFFFFFFQWSIAQLVERESFETQAGLYESIPQEWQAGIRSSQYIQAGDRNAVLVGGTEGLWPETFLSKPSPVPHEK